jgi:hypothetical protein
MILVSTVTIAVIVVAVIVVAAALTGVAATRRRRRLQRRFGPEYDRLADERDSKLKAESELAGRERRVQGLDIQPLTDSARTGYALQWAAIQEQFVDIPEDAVAASQVLVAAVMSELGYPVEDPDQMLADLSVEHAATLDRYRAAEQTCRSAAAGTASTEDLRLAMIDYRALFRDLVGEPGEGKESATAEPEPAIEAGELNPGRIDVQAADTEPEIVAAGLVADRPGQQPSRMSVGEPAK